MIQGLLPDPSAAIAPTDLAKSPYMQITDLLAPMGGLQSITGKLGVNETRAASGADALTGKRAQIISTTEGIST